MAESTTTEVDTDPLFTAEETADYLRVHLNTAFKLLRENVIPATKVGRQWRVRRSDLDAFLSRRKPTVLGEVHSDRSQNYFVIVGPSGSGKTQIAQELRARYPGVHVEEVQVPVVA
ncbi:DNA binding domain, excisionase family [Mycobacteroides abscessus subsp. abscessus]|nr:helix-turn-helix domain-containing protein [Mycobacteroides abscessus]SHP28967.1 DNA binding domain, excisionase family [Mycobacteroides abscessus subsp. abscessus]SHP69204.1 DNA binding domain, excisionase family [Mycobacteroides abscessus subsp. abscessus]SHY39450.1 DNA binding domain, excisionase family [Mycobacteroides abscessus subsp. abscessus]SKD93226.1 DNA binding domain, excisionase family [Mycobacteroides abscessus subsp. abscessus]